MQAAPEREAGHLLGAIFSACPDAVLVVDGSGMIVLSSPAVTTLFGYYPEELVGEPVDVLLPAGNQAHHPGHLEAFFAAPWARLMGAGQELAGLPACTATHRSPPSRSAWPPWRSAGRTTPLCSSEMAGNAKAPPAPKPSNNEATQSLLVGVGSAAGSSAWSLAGRATSATPTLVGSSPRPVPASSSSVQLTAPGPSCS